MRGLLRVRVQVTGPGGRSPALLRVCAESVSGPIRRVRTRPPTRDPGRPPRDRVDQSFMFIVALRRVGVDVRDVEAVAALVQGGAMTSTKRALPPESRSISVCTSPL